MTPRPANLDQIERWMQAVLMHPGGVEEGVGSGLARKQLDVSLDELEEVIRPSKLLTAARRLAIYVDAYHERLMECLREEFPATRAAVGDDELFDALAFGYLQHHPSRSYTLAQLGRQFADFLAESRPHAHQAPPSGGPTWPDFVIELARFERLLREVFDAQGSETLGRLDLEALSQVSADAWSGLRLTPTPALRLATFSHEVHRYWRTIKDDGSVPPPLPPQTVHLAIFRRDYVVATQELSGPRFELLSALCEGARLHQAIEHAARRESPPAAISPPNLHAWFAEWSSLGFFVPAVACASG